MIWLDILKIAIAGGVLGFVVGKLIVQRPYYLERLHPKFWMRIAKKMKREDWLKLLAISLTLTLICFYLIGYLSIAMERLWGPEALYSSEEYIFAKIPDVALLVIATTVPILEEWVFRGILQEEISRRLRSRLFGIILSALLFAFFHLSNPGTYLAATFPLFFGGVLFGVCYLRAGLAGAMICHSTYNLLLLLNVLPLPGV